MKLLPYLWAYLFKKKANTRVGIENVPRIIPLHIQSNPTASTLSRSRGKSNENIIKVEMMWIPVKKLINGSDFKHIQMIR